MSSSYHIYVGPYVKVTRPCETKSHGVMTCPKESCMQFQKRVTSKCCPECGTPIKQIMVPRVRYVDTHELMLEHLHDEDLFRTIYLDEKTELCIPNRRDQGGLTLSENDTTEHPLPIMEFLHDDWKKLTSILDAQGVVYDKKTGIIEWCD